MPNDFVISCFPDGTVEHTLKDPIFKFPGEREVKRVSIIEFDTSTQKFAILWLRGIYADRYCQGSMLTSFGLFPGDFDFPIYVEQTLWTFQSGKLFFDSYEQAVEVEVAMLDKIRLSGYRLSEGSSDA